MSEMDDRPNEGDAAEGPREGDLATVRAQQVGAIVPEEVARGVFASGSMVVTGAHEFVVDFVQTLTRPHQLVARVVLPPTIVESVIGALKQNLANYERRFGPPMELPRAGDGGKAPGSTPGSGTTPGSVAAPGSGSAAPPEEVYAQLKISDRVAAGVYANMVMITHSPAEFCFDFITRFFPRATVASRVYMAAPQAPRLLETLTRMHRQYEQRRGSLPGEQEEEQDEGNDQ